MARRIRIRSASASRNTTCSRQVPALLDQDGAEDNGSQGAAPPLATGQQPVNQQLQRALELRARGRLGQFERFAHQLGSGPGAEHSVATDGQLVGEQAL